MSEPRKFTIVVGEHFYTESLRMRALAAREALDKIGIRASRWRRLRAWFARLVGR